ncbi:hypothetical protein [Agrobacterium tumefaciens]|uniref:hypothetical protein n=1 Tax=Agrobacterium tumefaciens TaxID=358 RepID=UPI001FAB0DB8|nr:hypothetical protein [Agrobacterium tumefaciens]UNZ53830.1 hypothetical protein MLE07_24135 [Agrobacterium tumefaciens]
MALRKFEGPSPDLVKALLIERSEAACPDYYATRIQVALQYRKANCDNGKLHGRMKEDKESELDVRAELAKWYPVRRHMRDFSKKSGIGYSSASFRLRAQVFSRDIYHFNLTGSQREFGEQAAAITVQSTTQLLIE